MRGLYSITAGFLFICMLMLPLTHGSNVKAPKGQDLSFATVFRVKTDDGIKNIAADEYILGVVSAEMPALYDTEALKAQAVASYTFAVRKAAENKENEYDLTDSGASDQAYTDQKTRKEKWGKNAQEYEKRISDAVRSVLGQTVKYDGEPILALYHAVSCGKTETAKTVFGTDYPYLQTVESIGDMLCDTYLSEVSFSLSKICEALGITYSGNADEFIGEASLSDIGTVRSIVLGGSSFSGSDVRSALSLRSANFEAEKAGENIKFTVRGYGHGVGMSQYGANCMAKDGAGYKEILTYYYTGCTVE